MRFKRVLPLLSADVGYDVPPFIVATMERCLLATCLTPSDAAFRLDGSSYRDRIGALKALERALLRHQNDEIVRAISDDFTGRAAEETLALELVPTLGEIRDARKHLKELDGAPRRPGRLAIPAGARADRDAAERRRRDFGSLELSSVSHHRTGRRRDRRREQSDDKALRAGASHRRSASSKSSKKTFPPDYICVINGGSEVAEEFSRLPFDHLIYTGSARVGKMVMKAAAENLTPVTLELGGKSPALVHPDYPLERAAERILTGKLYNAGQTCVAPDYLLIANTHVGEFLKIAPRIVGNMYPKLVANPDYTRIIDAAHYRTLARTGRRRGAERRDRNPRSTLRMKRATKKIRSSRRRCSSTSAMI